MTFYTIYLFECSELLLFHVVPVFFNYMQESLACSSSLMDSSLLSDKLELFSDSSYLFRLVPESM